jgi:hypothetical protein
MATGATAAALQQAAAGLTYQSETDAPWQAFHWPDAEVGPTAGGVREQGRHKKGAKVEEQTVDEFFSPLTQDQDWYGEEEKAQAAKYRALFTAVKQLLENSKVFRVGGRKQTVYVVGQAPEGGWAGLKTTAVET